MKKETLDAFKKTKPDIRQFLKRGGLHTKKKPRKKIDLKDNLDNIF